MRPGFASRLSAMLFTLFCRKTRQPGAGQPRAFCPAARTKKGRPNKGALSGVFAVSRAQPCVLEEDAAASLLAVPASPGMPVGFGWARYSSSVRPLALIFWAWSTPT